jgi:hypothetical protein
VVLSTYRRIEEFFLKRKRRGRKEAKIGGRQCGARRLFSFQSRRSTPGIALA